MKLVRCTLSGSFHRDSDGLKRIYRELAQNGCQILSPHTVEFDETKDSFVKHSTENGLTQDFLERHHLMSIRQSDFLWVHCPDGYVGNSTALEIGAAYSYGIPVYSHTKPLDSTIALFVSVVPSVFYIVDQISD